MSKINPKIFKNNWLIITLLWLIGFFITIYLSIINECFCFTYSSIIVLPFIYLTNYLHFFINDYLFNKVIKTTWTKKQKTIFFVILNILKWLVLFVPIILIFILIQTNINVFNFKVAILFLIIYPVANILNAFIYYSSSEKSAL